MNVICFGDSNTYGYDPRGCFGGRYDADSRWVDILAARTGWNIKNEGMNGRELPRGAISVPGDTDLLIVMLGTNDLLQGRSVDVVAARMEKLVTGLTRRKVLLIGPPPMQLGAWVPAQGLINASKELNRAYKALAQRLGIRFVDAGAWNISLAFDGVHFTEEGHRAFAEGLYQELTEGNEGSPPFRRSDSHSPNIREFGGMAAWPYEDGAAYENHHLSGKENECGHR